MKRSMILFAAALLAALTTTAAALQHQQLVLSQKLVRLHVVANSDSDYDQELKLHVRDAVLQVTEKAGRIEDLALLLPEIQKAAEYCLAVRGSSYPVAVTLRRETFPTRDYDAFALPAGPYTALRVTIGTGEGKNWWCVAFPSICLCAASEVEEAAAAAGLSQEEVKLITKDGGDHVLRFKALEILQRFKDRWLRPAEQTERPKT